MFGTRIYSAKHWKQCFYLRWKYSKLNFDCFQIPYSIKFPKDNPLTRKIKDRSSLLVRLYCTVYRHHVSRIDIKGGHATYIIYIIIWVYVYNVICVRVCFWVYLCIHHWWKIIKKKKRGVRLVYPFSPSTHYWSSVLIYIWPVCRGISRDDSIRPYNIVEWKFDENSSTWDLLYLYFVIIFFFFIYKSPVDRKSFAISAVPCVCRSAYKTIFRPVGTAQIKGIFCHPHFSTSYPCLFDRFLLFKLELCTFSLQKCISFIIMR